MKWATAFIALTAVARFAGSDIFLFVVLGLRSQSLAPPQALCLRPLRGLRAGLLRGLSKHRYTLRAKPDERDDG